MEEKIAHFVLSYISTSNICLGDNCHQSRMDQTAGLEQEVDITFKENNFLDLSHCLKSNQIKKGVGFVCFHSIQSTL